MTTEIVLSERRVTRDLQLSPAQVRLLREAEAGLEVIATAEPGRFDVRAAQWVGTVVGRDCRVLIRPKLPIERVLYLLSRAESIPDLGEDTMLAAATDLVSVMQAVLAHSVSKALRSGIVRDYRATEDRLPVLRGVPDLKGLVLRRHGVFPPVDCSFEEFTADVEPNRRVVAALLLLARGPSAARLRGLAALFEGVDVRGYGRVLRPLELNRRWERWRVAVRLSELVLRSCSVELHEGNVDSVGMLINMDDLFEKYVVTELGLAMADCGLSWAYHPPGLWLDEERVVVVTPDVLVRDRDRAARLVLDVKYKREESSDDLYQMLAYCVSQGVRAGVIVYARAGEDHHVVNKSGVTLHVFEFDPGGTPEALRARAAALAARVQLLAKSMPALPI